MGLVVPLAVTVAVPPGKASWSGPLIALVAMAPFAKVQAVPVLYSPK